MTTKAVMTERERGIYAKQKGEVGEKVASYIMHSLGVRNLQKIGTPVKLVPPANPRARAEFFRRVIFEEKVSGDWWGIMPGSGRSVLVEVKTHDEDRFQFSILKPHQVYALDSQVRCNGLAFLVWIHLTGEYVLRWPVSGLEPGKSISIQDARLMNVEVING